MLKNLSKKLMAMCVVMTLVLSCVCVPVAFAATPKTETVGEINGWKFIMYSENDSFHSILKEDCSISVSSDWARGGSKSLKIVYPNKPVNPSTGSESGAAFYLNLSAQSLGILEPGTYTLTYSLHAVDAEGNVIEDGTKNTSTNIHKGKHIPILNGSNNMSATIGNGRDAIAAKADVISEGTGINGYFTQATRTFTITPEFPTKTVGNEVVKIMGAYRSTAPSQANIDEFLNISFRIPFNKYTAGYQPAAIYIDEISLKRDGSDENLIVNGSFEDNAIQNPVYSEKAVVADTAVATLGKVALTWKNPSKALKSVKLYDITDGNETEVVGFTQNLTAGYKNSVDIEGAEKTRRYYKVVNTFTDDEVSEFILSADAAVAQKNNPLVKGWTVKDNGTKQNGYIHKTIANIDTSIKRNGNSSLHIRSGRSVYSYSEYLDVMQTLPALDSHVKDGGYYKMSMWVKKNNSQSFFTRINNDVFPGWKADGTNNNFYLIQLNGNGNPYTHGWQYFEYVFSPVNDTVLGISSKWTEGAAFNWEISQFSGADDVWVDDVTLIKCDANGKALDGATNLVTNGGFELAEDFAVEGFSADDVTLEGADGQITVSYPEIAAGEKVNIYFTDENGIKEFKGSLYEDKRGFTFKNLVNKQNYEITVAKADAVTGVEQEEAVVKTCAPVPPAVVIGEYVLSDAEDVKENAKTPGTYSVTLNVKNNLVTDGYTAYLIYALYNSDNEMIDFDYDNNNGQAISVDNEYTYTLSNIAVGEGETLKVFFWDGFTKINPIKPFKNFCE